jgi:hypothetical protein
MGRFNMAVRLPLDQGAGPSVAVAVSAMGACTHFLQVPSTKQLEAVPCLGVRDHVAVHLEQRDGVLVLHEVVLSLELVHERSGQLLALVDICERIDGHVRAALVA